MALSDKIEIFEDTERGYIEDRDVKQFIREDWVLTNHFLWDLFRKWEIDEDVIEDEITKLHLKKNKLAGDNLL